MSNNEEKKVVAGPLTIELHRFNGKAFGAYLAGKNVIAFDMEAALVVDASNPEITWSEVVSWSVLHEILHFVQEKLCREFDEAEIDEAIKNLGDMMRERNE